MTSGARRSGRISMRTSSASFPDREPIELPLEHEIFHCVYDLKKKPQVPSIHHWHSGDTTERPGTRTAAATCITGHLRR